MRYSRQANSFWPVEYNKFCRKKGLHVDVEAFVVQGRPASSFRFLSGSQNRHPKHILRAGTPRGLSFPRSQTQTILLRPIARTQGRGFLPAVCSIFFQPVRCMIRSGIRKWAYEPPLHSRINIFSLCVEVKDKFFSLLTEKCFTSGVLLEGVSGDQHSGCISTGTAADVWAAKSGCRTFCARFLYVAVRLLQFIRGSP